MWNPVSFPIWNGPGSWLSKKHSIIQAGCLLKRSHAKEESGNKGLCQCMFSLVTLSLPIEFQHLWLKSITGEEEPLQRSSLWKWKVLAWGCLSFLIIPQLPLPKKSKTSLFMYSPEAYAKGSHRLLSNNPVVTFCPNINTNKCSFYFKKCPGGRLGGSVS